MSEEDHDTSLDGIEREAVEIKQQQATDSEISEGVGQT